MLPSARRVWKKPWSAKSTVSSSSSHAVIARAHTCFRLALDDCLLLLRGPWTTHRCASRRAWECPCRWRNSRIISCPPTSWYLAFRCTVSECPSKRTPMHLGPARRCHSFQ
ncbi:hypothetical protein BV20DRAFT_812483 [Pilatotrama ljubarskyi]|nr:hypothetical protein BV20DRAFT_812483 [Pilatotrama ljubarskyi]